PYVARLMTSSGTVLGTMTIYVGIGANASLAGSVTSGAVPLTVTFTGMGTAVNGQLAALDFGDGQTDTTIQPGSFTRTHTYTSNGAFTARLFISATNAVLAIAPITVGTQNTNGGALTASPQSGASPLSVSFSGNTNGVAYPGGYSINYGDGTAATSCGNSAAP